MEERVEEIIAARDTGIQTTFSVPNVKSAIKEVGLEEFIKNHLYHLERIIREIDAS